MKIAVLLVALVISGEAAYAFDCPLGKEGPLLPIRWSAYDRGADVTVTLGVQNTFDRQVRMVAAEVYFVDGLGRTVGNGPLSVDPDLQIFGNGANAGTMIAPTSYSRLTKGQMSDFTPHICTEAILFTDGSKAEF